MSLSNDQIRCQLRGFLLRQFLPGEDPRTLAEDTPLFGRGILDSISILQYTVFIEKQFGVALRGQDLTRRSLDTIASAAALIESRQGRDR